MGVSPSKEPGEYYSKVLEKPTPQTSPGKVEIATFAAGCFWGIELVFQRLPGVIETAVGYTDGKKENPTYEEVCSGTTGHAEAVQVKFDPATIMYEELVRVFWERIEPTAVNRQGNDRGTQYRSGIYYHSDAQKEVAERTKKEEQAKHNEPIATEIKPASTFWKAEEYHQHYLEKGGQCARKGDKSAIRCYG